MSESNVQKYLISEAKKIGGLAVKVDCSSRRGWPDIILLRSGCDPALVEIKNGSAGVLSDQQVSTHAMIRDLGTPVWVVSSKTEVDTLLYG